jgi:organic radical activating enzyme
MKKYKYSEIFGKTIQGEGRYTGIPTVWIRFWGCNFECNGFGQENPEDKSTYILDYQTIDVSSIKRMIDLPVFSKGCDSSYSWSKKFSHLANSSTVEDICDQLEDFLKSESNPEGKFLHPVSKQWTHMAFTGGEPMMNQNAIVDIMEEFDRRNNLPYFVTIETNGTQSIREKFDNYFSEFAGRSGELFWSVSPKLYLSGEKWEEAIQPKVLAQYFMSSETGQLKYVSNGTDRSWDEVTKATKLYRDAGVDWPVWIMPVGADVEGQNKVAAKVTEGAVERGYNVAARVHTYIFGNSIGK